MKKEKIGLISTKEASEILNMSRMHVIRLIKQGEIKAFKVGRSYLIDRNSLGGIFKEITSEDKRRIDKAVEKTIRRYGEVLRKLGSE